MGLPNLSQGPAGLSEQTSFHLRMTGVILYTSITAHGLIFNDMQIFHGSVARLPLRSGLAFLPFRLW
jgi:hypothetical protein